RRPGLRGKKFHGPRKCNDRRILHMLVLLKDRENDTATRSRQRSGQLPIFFRRRGRAEVDVHKYISSFSIHESVDYSRMDRTRPGPGANVIQALLVNRRKNEAVRGVARRKLCSQTNELAVNLLNRAGA